MTTTTQAAQATRAGGTKLFRHDKTGEVQREFLGMLCEGYCATIIGKARGGLIIEPSHGTGVGGWWFLNDNGGELNVARINDPSSLRSIPAHGRDGAVNGHTMAYRVLAVIRGEQIDYGFRFSEAA